MYVYRKIHNGKISCVTTGPGSCTPIGSYGSSYRISERLGTTRNDSDALGSQDQNTVPYSCTVTDLIRRHNSGAKRFSRKAACPG
jgi:hypothetical protein